VLGTVDRQVVYNLPEPSQLTIEANPREVVNDGRTSVNVSVLLLDSANRPTSYPDRDVDVFLTASLGELPVRQVRIPKGTSFAEATLTSTRHGEARIAARATGLAEAATTVRFLFPILMLNLAVLGGVLGGYVRAGRGSFSANWWPNLWRNLVLGAILGVVFYGLAFFGAVTAVPKAEIPVEIAKIPTFNELGAFVLGFIGGVVGRQFWKVADGSEDKDKAQEDSNG